MPHSSVTLTLEGTSQDAHTVKKVLRVKPKKSVKWDTTAVDNENQGKKKSKSKPGLWVSVADH